MRMISKATLLLCIGICIFLPISTTAIAQPLEYRYFDSFEDSKLNPFWEEFSSFVASRFQSGVVHGGSQALELQALSGGQRTYELRHTLEWEATGTVSAWLYDSAPGQGTQYVKLRLRNTRTGQNRTIGLADWMASNYTVSSETDTYENIVDYPRTIGWHHLQIQASSDSVKYTIDGQVVYTDEGEFRFDEVVLLMYAPYWRPGGTFYWDDFSLITPLADETVTTLPGPASAQALSATTIGVSAPFVGDSNQNGYTTFEYASSPEGDWTSACHPGLPGPPAWRQCALGDLAPDSDYFIRVIYHDDDGVIPLESVPIIGPVRTEPDVINSVIVESIDATIEDTHILVSVPIREDANRNSTLERVEVAESSSGPWTEKCGPVARFAPKICRIHSLNTDTDYWVRVLVSDPDGVAGVSPETVGPLLYTGYENRALGKSIAADPGWGCCSNPSELVDGRIQYSNWMHGFAWTGGLNCWSGGMETSNDRPRCGGNDFAR